MQGQRNTIDSFPETVDIDHGCVSNNIGTSESTSWNNVLNPLDSRLSNYAASSGEATCVNAIGHDVQSFSGWDMGETSSRLILQNQVNNDGVKVECDWSPSFSVHAGAGPSSEERQFEPTNVLLPGRVNIGLSGNQITSGPLYLQRSNHNPQTVSLNSGYVGNCSNGGQGMVAGVPNIYKPGGLERGQISSSSSSSDNVGSSSGISGHALEENNCGINSLGSWGSSCKRKALEGTPGHSFAASSSSCFPQAENGVWQTGTVHYNASSSLNLSTPPWNSFGVGLPQQLNPRIGVGMRGIASDTFPAIGVTGIAENHMRNFGRRASSGHQQESMPLNLSTGSASHSNVFSIHQSPRPVPYMDSLDVRSKAVVASSSSAPQSQSHVMRASVMSTNVPLPWNGSSTSRSGTSSSSLFSGERGAASREAPNSRSISRNNVDHPMFLPAMQIRNMAQDPTSWSLPTGNGSIPGDVQSTPRIGPSSSVQPLHTPAWISHHNPQTQNQQRSSAFAHWSFFPSVDSESRGHSGHFPPSPSGPSASLQETAMPAGGNTRGRGHHQPYPRTALMDRHGDDVLGFPHSLRVLAADIEGRHRLISELKSWTISVRFGCFG